MNERIEWIDIAKGIGILLVIAGHTISLTYSYPIYAFHMPLFFFLSGLVHKDKGDSFLVFSLKKANALIRPWIIIIFISFLVCLSISQWRDELSIRAIILDFYTANTNTLQNSSLWYLVCFYFVLLLFFFINKIERTLYFIAVFVGFSISLLWIKNLLDISSLPLNRFPFKIDSAMIAVVFFSIASWYKDSIINYVEKNINILFVFLFCIGSFVLCILNGWSNINSLEFGNNRILYYPIAFLGIGSICLMSNLIAKHSCQKIKKILIFYGKNSLLVFGFQSLFIRLYILFFNNIQGLSMELYGDNPLIHQLGSFIMVSFVISPIIVSLFLYLRNRNIIIL
jgi:fucose 4-O-acetylase-like acetyltransferase